VSTGAGTVATGITSDNIHLSEPIKARAVGQKFAVGCKSHEVADAKVLEFLQAAKAPNTRRAYECDEGHFLAWGGQIPATEVHVVRYLADHAGRLAIATLTRRLVAIRLAHVVRGLPDPTKSELVRLTFRGIRRKHGQPQRRVAPLLPDDLRAIISSLGQSVRDIRDAAVLLVGFAGAFRRSELVAIDCKEVEVSGRGAIIRIPRSKTDQEGYGRTVGIPRTQGLICPVAAYEQWLAVAEITDGPVFRAVRRGGCVLPGRISAEAIALIVKERASTIGLDASRYSGHSLRAGFATSAANAGVSERRIRLQTGHISNAGLRPYVRNQVVSVDPG
jgi:integrase